ncbi:MAG: DUF885 domain-containing protein [Anaerolineae bacterium]|nr:DUF885 domain-containing protein [Anaerolineae bacterium]MDW8067476.1 DUF885 domain-containing protein [Anaerolineae bacterium]
MTTETQFYHRAREWLHRFAERNPVTATFMGIHSYDHRLGERTPPALEEEQREIRAALAELRAMDLSDFRPDARIDHTLLTHLLASFVRSYEKFQGHLRHPGGYLEEPLEGVFLLILRDFAPLPERLRSALGRVQETPRLLREGMNNIIPERVPRVWAEIALEQARQAPGLFLGLLPAIAAGAAPDLQADLAQAGQTAAQAIQEYAAFIENDVLPRAASDFAAGRALFDEMLREEHMVDYDADQLLQIGWEQFHLTRRQMEEVARQIDPNRSAQDLLEEAKNDHPTAEGLLDAYREAMAAVRQYVIDHQIASIPEGEILQIVETPSYLRPVIPYAAYIPPGILEERQEGIFLVTPVDPNAPPEVQEQTLRGHSWAKLPVTALHEAYPGHHLQLVWANRQETIPRRLGSFLATLFIEGWAFYCEELMEKMGYIAEPIQRLGRLSDQLWRAARIILDVSLHTRGMSVEEAVDFLVRECQLEPTNALAEVRRYTTTPTQPQSYLMGKLAILELVADYRRAHPEASLRQIHDAILGCGSLPPRLMRQRLFRL